jgi:hypothetical protein
MNTIRNKLGALFVLAFWLTLSTVAQDTTCVMITLDEVINFNYETSKIINRFDHAGDFEIKIKDGEIMCLHFSDDKNRFRDVTTTFENGDHIHNTFSSKDNVVFSKESWGDVTIHISKARRKK